jgi:hypothetical protein
MSDRPSTRSDEKTLPVAVGRRNRRSRNGYVCACLLTSACHVIVACMVHRTADPPCFVKRRFASRMRADH